MAKVPVSGKEVQNVRLPLGTISGGLWLDVPPEECPENAWTDGYNFVVDSEYKATPRKGRDELADILDDLGTPPDDHRIYGITELRSFQQNNALYVFIGDKLAKYNGSVWSWQALGGYTITEGEQWQSCMGGGPGAGGGAATYKEYLLCVCDDNELLVIDESGTLSVPDTSRYYGSGPAGTNLKPKWAAMYMNRLWISGAPPYDASVFASYAGDSVDFNTTAASGSEAQEVLVGRGDGEKIVGIITKFGYLFVIKERSIWYVNAQDPDPVNWEVRKFASGVGGTEGCGHTLQDIGTDVLFMSQNGNLVSLRDTEKAGLMDVGSLSSLQIRSYLRLFDYSKASSVVDSATGRYVLAMTTSQTLRNNGFAAFDYGKRNEQGKGLWYRFDNISVYDAGANVVQSARTVFGVSTLFNTAGNDEVLCGGYDGRIYREFAQTKEDLDDGSSEFIRAWFAGKHVLSEDYTEFRLHKITGFATFGGQPEGTTVEIGAILDPVERNLIRSQPVAMSGDYGDAAYWGEFEWNDGARWGVAADALIEATIAERGKAFAFYVTSFGSRIELSRMFAIVETGVV